MVINFKNRIPHDDMFPLLRDGESGELVLAAYPHPGAAARRLADFVEARTTAMANEVGKDPVIALFEGKKALPGMLVFVEAVVGAVSPRGPSPTMIGFLHLTTFEEPETPSRFTEAVMSVIRGINGSLQSVPAART